MDTFSIGSMISFGWETFKKRPWILIGALIIMAVVSAISSSLTKSLQSQHGFGLWLVGFVISIGISTLIKKGQINFTLKAHDTIDTVSLGELWHPQQYWNFFATMVSFGVIVIVGLILLIVPGIIWGLRYMFALYLVTDKQLGVSAALKESARITQGHKADLALLGLALIGINIVGMLCLLVGLLVTVPLSQLAIAHAYRTLSGASSDAPSATPVAAM